LLRIRQHEIATRGAVAAPIEAQAQVSRRWRLKTRAARGRALIRLSFTRASARFARPSAGLPRGGGPGPKRAGTRTRHNRNSNRQQDSTYGAKSLKARHLCRLATPAPRTARKAQVPLTQSTLLE
jgi:hypothetical protein